MQLDPLERGKATDEKLSVLSPCRPADLVDLVNRTLEIEQLLQRDLRALDVDQHFLPYLKSP